MYKIDLDCEKVPTVTNNHLMLQIQSMSILQHKFIGTSHNHFIAPIHSLQCVRSFSQDTLFKQLEEKERTKIAIIGSGCSLATEPSAEISHFFNIPQVIRAIKGQKKSHCS